MVFSQLRSSRSNKTRRAMGFSAAPRKNSWIWHEHPRTDESVCVIEESTKQIKYQAGHQVPSGYFGWVLTHKRFMFFLALRPRRQCFDWVALVCNWHRLHFSVSFTTSLEMPFTVGTRDAERERVQPDSINNRCSFEAAQPLYTAMAQTIWDSACVSHGALLPAMLPVLQRVTSEFQPLNGSLTFCALLVSLANCATSVQTLGISKSC